MNYTLANNAYAFLSQSPIAQEFRDRFGCYGMLILDRFGCYGMLIRGLPYSTNWDRMFILK